MGTLPMFPTCQTKNTGSAPMFPKMEQVYTQLQTRIKDVTTERMTTMERSLAALAAAGKVAPLEAEKWEIQGQIP